MVRIGYRYMILVFLIGGSVLSMFEMAGWVRADEVYDCHSEENRKKSTTLEITLSKKWKKQAEEVQQAFMSGSENTKVRIGFFPFLDPPTNIGIGKCVTAGLARQAIRQAIIYNRGVEKLILQNVIPHHWVGIGTTKLAELSWMPVGSDDLDRLMNPELSTEEFHKLYRELARMKERKRPFGLDPIPYDSEKE